MTLHSRLKFFECGKYLSVFNCEELTLKLYPALAQCVRSNSDSATLKPVDIDFLLGNSSTRSSNDFSNSLLQNTVNSHRKTQQPALYRLSLVVSNICNMACKYCYARGGRYYGEGILMEEETALNAVNFAKRNFSTIELINFFGGEPTLNEDVIELVCEYFRYLHSNGVLSYVPRFGITTNAYALSNRMLRIIREYNLTLSISLDGPKDIHDRLRVNTEGLGTYDTIVQNIKKMIEEGIIPEFECTYTLEHFRQGIDVIGLMDFFYDNFNCQTLHCPMVIANPASKYFIPLRTATRLYEEAIRYSVANLACGIPNSLSIAKRLLRSLATRISQQSYCPAGESSITINADGNIYPCFLLMQGSEFSLGNVNRDCSESKRPRIVESLLQNSNKWQNSACQNCWAQSLCFGCLGDDISREGIMFQRSVTPGQSSICDFRRKMIEVFLRSVSEVVIIESRR